MQNTIEKTLPSGKRVRVTVTAGFNIDDEFTKHRRKPTNYTPPKKKRRK